MSQKEKMLDQLNNQLYRCVSAFSKKISKIASSQQLGNSNSDFFSQFKNNITVSSSDSKNQAFANTSISLALKFIEDEIDALYLIGSDCGYNEDELIAYYAKSNFNQQITKTVTMFFYSLMQESTLSDIKLQENTILKSFLSILNKYNLNLEEIIKEVCSLGTNKMALSIKNAYPLFMAMSQFSMEHDILYKNVLAMGAASDKENGAVIKSLYDLGVRFNLSDDFLLKNEITFDQLPTILYQSKITNKTKLFLKVTQYQYNNENSASLPSQTIDHLKAAIDYVDSNLLKKSLGQEIPIPLDGIKDMKIVNKKPKTKTAKV